MTPKERIEECFAGVTLPLDSLDIEVLKLSMEETIREAIREENERCIEIIQESKKDLMQTILSAIEIEREACAKIADGHMPNGPDPIGPLHGAGRAFAAKNISVVIRQRSRAGNENVSGESVTSTAA